MKSSHIRIGCAGWSVPAVARAQFGEGNSVLERYATRFNAVEINASFYRPHRTDTYRRWAESVPGDFAFAVKMPRTITHDARLHKVGKLLDAFLAEVAGLAEKLEVILVQLPPAWTSTPGKRALFSPRSGDGIADALRLKHAMQLGSARTLNPY